LILGAGLPAWRLWEVLWLGVTVLYSLRIDGTYKFF